MKPRRVIITLEIETDVPISNFKKKDNLFVAYRYNCKYGTLRIIQVQANVVKKK